VHDRHLTLQPRVVRLELDDLDDLFLGHEANEATLEGVGLRVVGLGVVASGA
jgi:hypothetical protein